MSRPKLGKFWRFWGLGVRGYKKFRFLLQKAHVFVNPRRLSHFASKSVVGCDLQVGLGKKNPESHRGSHRKDMSPLTQGLNYRSACDSVKHNRSKLRSRPRGQTDHSRLFIGYYSFCAAFPDPVLAFSMTIVLNLQLWLFRAQRI